MMSKQKRTRPKKTIIRPKIIENKMLANNVSLGFRRCPDLSPDMHILFYYQ